MKKVMVVVLLLACCALWAQAPARHGVTPEELISMTRLRSLAVSPDGSKILYVAGGMTYPAPPDNPCADKLVFHIFMVPPSGGTPRQMTASAAGESGAAWAPDGTRLAFVSKRAGSLQIFVMPVDGGEGAQVGKMKIEPSDLKWSPDGKAIAFLAVPEPPKEQKEEDERTGGAEIFESPRDMQQIFTLSVPEGKLTQVTAKEYQVNAFSWAPDGRSFALSTSPTQLPYDVSASQTVRRVDLAGKTLAVLSDKARPVDGPALFSPDGTRVAWLGTLDSPSLSRALWINTADGKSLQNAAATLDFTFGQIAWSENGKALLALTHEGTRSCLRRIDPEAGTAGVLFAPAGSIMGFSTDRAASIVAFPFSATAMAGDPWSIRADGTGARRLTELNPQVKNWVLPTVERIRFKNPDGQEIEGLFSRTPLASGGRPAPLMVMPHGGPDWMDQESFDRWEIYFAGRGYNLLRVNFRGSLGYGLAFYAANRGQMGFADYDDIMAGVDYLISRKDADPETLVIGGWSYGGCMTEWAITRTPRFKAAVVGAGVGNYYSNYAQSDINHGLAGDWEFLGNPYDNPENFDRGSAVRHIRTVQTPVLILHGKEDERVPFPQALELYRALKTTGKEVELVAYPGEPHGPRKPEHVVDLFKRWSDFYDKHLGIVRETPKNEAVPAEPKLEERKAG
jgi:dipeptidyl aminopeptidase/acylaminoacyl peptidase